MYAWLFMRYSGLLLVFLAVGHLMIMHLIHSVEEVDYAFVAKRFTTPFWRGYDLLMLWLALIHGTNGIRTILDDYLHNKRGHFLAMAILFAVTVIFLAIGTVVLVGFHPPAMPIQWPNKP